MPERTAAIVTIGTELTEGLRVDTNSAEIASALVRHGFHIEELVSLPDHVEKVAAALAGLIGQHDLVVTTGGLGPTHDDVTREAAARALGATLRRDPRLETLLLPAVARHSDPEAAGQILTQADVLEGSEVIDPTTGTAPGLVVSTAAGLLALLPGPPAEMRPMLGALLSSFDTHRAAARDLGVTGLTESDAQVTAQRALEGAEGVELTVLARPGDVRVVLHDGGAGDAGLDSAAAIVARAFGAHCYSKSGESLPQALVAAATAAGVTFALAESCTGGLAAALVTDVPGASACFAGGIVAYSDRVKTELLDVEPDILESHGAVSEQTALAMAEGARDRLHADIAASVTGIAGPTGGTAEKPVGLVCFGVAHSGGSYAITRRFPPTSRTATRDRSAAVVLDQIRRQILFP